MRLRGPLKRGPAILLWMISALVLLARGSMAVPPVGNLQPANNYGTVTMDIVDDGHGNYVATFTVTDTQPAGGYGIKGVLVYSPYAPSSMSAPPRCQTTLYKNGYSWWDFNGAPDNNRDGIPDSMIAPGQTVDSDTFVLTYKKSKCPTLDPTKFVFGLHVIQAFTGNTFFALAGGTPTGKVGLSVSPTSLCVESGHAATLTYTITNTGSTTLNSIYVTDDFGTVNSTAISLGVGASTTVTRTINPTADQTVSVNVTAKDSGGHTVSAGPATISVNVVHPHLVLSKSATGISCVGGDGIPYVLPGTSVTYSYTVTNDGDVPLKNVTITDSKLGTISITGTLAPGSSVTSTKAATLNETTTNTASATGKDDCSGATATANSGAVTVKVVTPSIDITSSVNTNCAAVVPNAAPVVFTYVVKNTGDVALSGVVVTDDSTTTTVGTLAPGESKTVTRSVMATSDLTSLATASGSVGCVGTTVSKTVASATTVKVWHPALTMSITPQYPSVPAGETDTFTIKVNNTGDEDLANVVVTVQANGQGITLPGSPIASLPAGQSATLTFDLTINNNTTVQATASTTPGCASASISAQDQVTVTAVTDSVSIDVTPPSDCLLKNGQGTFTVTLTNTGDVDIDAFQLTGQVAGGTLASANLGTYDLPVGATQTISVPVSSLTGPQVTLTVNGLGFVFTVFPVTASGSASADVHNPSIGITAVADTNKTCVLAGTDVTITYTVTNTGDTVLNNVVVSDGAFTQTITTLGIGASQTLTNSIHASSDIHATATANATSACSNAPVSNNAAPIDITVSDAALTVAVTPAASCVDRGTNATFNFVVTNTGHKDLTNVQVVATINGASTTIMAGDVAAGQSKTIPFYAPANMGAPATVSGVSASATDTCSNSPVGATSTANLTVYACANITAHVVCDDSDQDAIAGATVNLMLGGVVKQTAVTDGSGNVTFTGVADGTYTLQVSADEHQPNASPSFAFATNTGDVPQTVKLAPLPIVWQAVPAYSGRVFFSDTAFFQSVSTGITLGPADLSNNAYASGPNAHPSTSTYKSYPYVGTIPTFGSQHYGGPGEPRIWVIMESPLRSENTWNGFSATNLIQVEDGIGTGAGRKDTFWNITLLGNQPFGDGLVGSPNTGIAHQYTATGINLSPAAPGTLAPATWTLLPSIQWSPIAGPAPATLQDIPYGWMARTRFSFQYPVGVGFAFTMNGTYTNVCGDLFNWLIHPDVDGGPFDPSAGQ